MPLLLSHPNLSHRTVTNADATFLYTVYASTRETEMGLATHWTEEQKKAFLQQQFTAQHTWYGQQYKSAYFFVIEVEGEPAGRLYLAPEFTDGSIRIIDIALLPAYRNKGYGESILRDVMALAQSNRRSVTIHVESFNPAKQLYQRLGFEIKDRKNEVYHLYEWRKNETIHSNNEAEYT